jgi:hypothetical protein
MDGADDGALRIRNRCLIEACREPVADGAGGGGGRGPVGGGYSGPSGNGDDGDIRCEIVADD